MSTAIKPFGLRLPPDLKQWLSGKAQANRRSMNSELIQMLERSRTQDQQAAQQK
ncbi:Arc family DNA-binding protein [Massilia sp. X63]|uniref:Arc family DNA-binding protein n=1 Tax=Massilia sp. X63 TaxID=3237285 RepID=UPI0034DD2A11